MINNCNKPAWKCGLTENNVRLVEPNEVAARNAAAQVSPHIFTTNRTAKLPDRLEARNPVVEPCPVQAPISAYGDDGGEVFRSDLITIDTPVIIIPEKIADICEFIQAKYRGNEFSILCKGKWDARGWSVGADYVIPKQKVGSASVYYQPDELQRLKMEGWNTVIHSHPMGMTKFSSGDMSNLNFHFPASILFCDGKFTDSTISVMVDEMVKMLIRPAIRTERERNVQIATDLLEQQIEVERTVYYNQFSQFGQIERHYNQYGRRGRSKNIEPVIDPDDIIDDPFGVWNGLY